MGITLQSGFTLFTSPRSAGVVANDLPSLLIAAVVVVFWAFIGCLLPAWKAARLNPLTALRND